MINNLEEKQLQIINPNGRLLTVAHRGDWINNPENSLSAFQSCIDMGIDIVELDVHKTKDGHLVVMHDSSVARTTNGTGQISELTLVQIKALRLKENSGGITAKLTNEKVPTLMEVMYTVKGKVLANIDKGWQDREQVYDVLKVTNTIDQTIIKSGANNQEVESYFFNKDIKPYYCAVFTDDNIDYLDGLLNGMKPQIIELLFQSDKNSIFSKDILLKVKGNTRIWVNTMWGSLCGDKTDDEIGWQTFIDEGINIIQTDNLKTILSYIKNNR